jgi:hypothetical protein
MLMNVTMYGREFLLSREKAHASGVCVVEDVRIGAGELASGRAVGAEEHSGRV